MKKNKNTYDGLGPVFAMGWYRNKSKIPLRLALRVREGQEWWGLKRRKYASDSHFERGRGQGCGGG